MRQAKIIIKDEVNIKIEGLELDIRRACFKKFEYETKTSSFNNLLLLILN